ncbi:GNAT family N-acetyltransferase [Haliovirga abyssi]|uniref:Acetyltransferase n=1 Tax=Haliovirga abyssi TaxID=2996794 RepID=A0AAU9DVH2_9FUSO|nr:GNAT family N-acetyltransferase [Haliovirga abyssi]BDU51369.1 acetyltransferase [Haliovirga abyssi]
MNNLKKDIIKIEKYTNINKKQYFEYIREWEKSEEKIIPWASRCDDLNFEELQTRWSKYEEDSMYAKGLVPSTLYFMIDENERIIGAIDVRHKLNENLKKSGGHIGYGIRLSERKKGYATLMLKLILDILKDKKYNKILITCNDENIASAKTIEKNGGIMENKIQNNEEIVRRYWVTL